MTLHHWRPSSGSYGTISMICAMTRKPGVSNHGEELSFATGKTWEKPWEKPGKTWVSALGRHHQLLLGSNQTSHGFKWSKPETNHWMPGPSTTKLKPHPDAFASMLTAALEIYHLVPSQSTLWESNMTMEHLWTCSFWIGFSHWNLHRGFCVATATFDSCRVLLVPVLSELCLPDPFNKSPTPTAPYPCHPQEQMCLLHVVDIHLDHLAVCLMEPPVWLLKDLALSCAVSKNPSGFIPKPGLSRVFNFSYPLVN